MTDNANEQSAMSADERRKRYEHEAAIRGEDAAIGLAERERAKILTEERDTALRELAEARNLLRAARRDLAEIRLHLRESRGRRIGGGDYLPCEPINGYTLWRVDDRRETFWVAVLEGESAVALLAAEHDSAEDGMRGAEARRASLHDVLTTKISDALLTAPGGVVSLWEAFKAQTEALAEGRSATRCVGATAW